MFSTVGRVVRGSPEGLELTRHLLIVIRDATHTDEVTSPAVRSCTRSPTWIGAAGSLPEALGGRGELD